MAWYWRDVFSFFILKLFFDARAPAPSEAKRGAGEGEGGLRSGCRSGERAQSTVEIAEARGIRGAEGDTTLTAQRRRYNGARQKKAKRVLPACSIPPAKLLRFSLYSPGCALHRREAGSSVSGRNALTRLSCPGRSPTDRAAGWATRQQCHQPAFPFRRSEIRPDRGTTNPSRATQKERTEQ
jgi:hypothetical protein